ncbi:Titin, partial [Frankliniella fusca]
ERRGSVSMTHSSPPTVPLLTLCLALAAGVGTGSAHSQGPAAAIAVQGGGGPAAAPPPPPPTPHDNATAGAAAASATARPAVKDHGFGLGLGYGRGGLDGMLAAVFNKVAKGTTATPMTTRSPPAPPTTTAAPTTTRPPPSSTQRPATPPPPTELVPLRPPPPMPPSLEAGLAAIGGANPTRRAPHPLPDYAPPNRPPPLPAEYNPFANKAILRGSQSEVGSATPGRKPHPQLVPPRPPMDELIPLRPVNTPSQGGGGGGGGAKGTGEAAAPAVEAPPRPERPPERGSERGTERSGGGKHHLDSHIHTVASAPAPAPALAPVGHHGGGHGHGHHTNGHDHALKAAKPTELLDQVNKDSIIDVQAGVAVVADPAIHRDEDNRDKAYLRARAEVGGLGAGLGRAGQGTPGPGRRRLEQGERALGVALASHRRRSASLQVCGVKRHSPETPGLRPTANHAPQSDAPVGRGRGQVLMSPATSPPSSVVRGGAAGGGPVAGAAGGEWHLAWTAQVYGLGTMWGVLGALCLLAAVFVDSRTRLVPRVHFSMLLALLLALAAANAVSLFYDVLNHDQLLQQQEQLQQQQQQRQGQQDEQEAAAAGQQGAPAGATRVPQLLSDLTLPFLPAAFSVFFFVVLRVNHVPCGSSGVPQTPAFLVLLFLFLATTMSLEVAACAKAAAGPGADAGAGAAAASTAWGGSGVGGGCGGGGMRSAARGITATVAALLGLAYLVVYRPLRRAAAKKQAEQLRAAYTAFRRLPTPALPRVVNALLACALLLVSLAAMATYRLMDATFLNSNADWRLPPWWYMRLAEHAGSLLVGFLLLWCATRGPSRGSDERSGASRGSRGTPGALSLVSCTGRRFLFDCPSTGSEENKTSEDNTYPAVCASNHAILNYTQHTGNKLYDDSFPLANLHSGQGPGQGPLNSSGDDFGSVPTMPKRHSAGTGAGVAKAGTLLPYNKSARRSAAAAAPGHHTLGPGGQLYDGDRDTLRRGARTTGRTRKPRHARHHQEVYSNCPQDDEYDFDQRIDLDGMADEFTVFKQYASTGSSESADNYDVPILVSAPESNKRHRRDRRDGHHHGHHHGGGSRRQGRQSSAPALAPAALAPADSLSPASPSDLSDCDRLSSNRSSYDETGPVRSHVNHHVHHNHHRGKVLLYDASEDDVTPDSAVVADITTSPRGGGGGGSHHSPREKRPGVGGGGGKRLARRQHQPVSQETPSSPELHDNVWSPQ